MARVAVAGGRIALAIVLMASPLTPGLAGAEVIDRVVATVGSRTITWSDVRAAVSLGLVAGAPTADPGGQAAVDAVVNRELVALEVERYGPGGTPEAAVDDRLAAISDRLGEGELARVMARAGLDPPRLRALVREQLQIERYVAERFGAAAQPTDDEVRRYFLERAAEFVLDGVPMSFEAAEPAAREALTAERRQRLVDDWVAGLRRRATVVIRTGLGL